MGKHKITHTCKGEPNIKQKNRKIKNVKVNIDFESQTLYKTKQYLLVQIAKTSHIFCG